jgi:regulator of protease activity HflC (stomatin/prohibitin superfamily)
LQLVDLCVELSIRYNRPDITVQFTEIIASANRDAERKFLLLEAATEAAAAAAAAAAEAAAAAAEAAEQVRKERALAVFMGLHKDLGVGSQFKVLDEEVLRMVCSYASPA